MRLSEATHSPSQDRLINAHHWIQTERRACELLGNGANSGEFGGAPPLAQMERSPPLRDHDRVLSGRLVRRLATQTLSLGKTRCCATMIRGSLPSLNFTR